jgi:hypothetical protein
MKQMRVRWAVRVAGIERKKTPWNSLWGKLNEITTWNIRKDLKETEFNGVDRNHLDGMG